MGSRRRYGKLLGVVGTVSAISVIAGFVVYWALSPTSSDSSKEGHKQSRCIIVTQTIANSGVTNWERLLDQEVVLVVPPEVTFPYESYKVIRCSTMSGLWSCVRHLKKDRLLLKQEELATPMPADVLRYTGQVIHISSQQDLSD